MIKIFNAIYFIHACAWLNTLCIDMQIIHFELKHPVCICYIIMKQFAKYNMSFCVVFGLHT